jgi:hypothetical protein
MARRPFNVFNMSFLDCMSCGFGAILLVFLIISAQITEQTEERVTDVRGDARRMEARVLGARAHLMELRSLLAALLGARDATRRETDAMRSALTATAEQVETAESHSEDREEAVEQLMAELRSLEEERRTAAERGRDTQGQQVRQRAGEGRRQYLTGLRIGGQHVLILVDTSASMLARSIVNVLRLRNMDEAMKRGARKWKQAVDTVDWLTTQLPPDGQFQIYGFSTQAAPLLEGSAGRWLDVGDGVSLEAAVEKLRAAVPGGGTNLRAAFEAIASLTPRADNVYLLVDGLPTQDGGGKRRGVVTGKQRLDLFRAAANNVILFPMEGDPDAAPVFWGLSRRTGGSLMSPSEDWPG